MKTKSIGLLFLLACMLLVSLPASAVDSKGDDFPLMPKLFGVFSPKVGVWAEYGITDPSTMTNSTMKMSIVGSEGDAYWYEVVNRDGKSTNIIKMLVKGNPNDSENIVRLILKSGDGPPTEMPRDFVVMGRRMATHMFQKRSGVPADNAEGYKRIDMGDGEAKVPAGTFKGTQHKVVDSTGRTVATYLFNEKVLPFGIVTSNTANGVMELLDYGTGAESRITGEVQKMELPPGMPQNMPRGVPGTKPQ